MSDWAGAPGTPGSAGCVGCPSALAHRYPLAPQLLARSPPGMVRRVAATGPGGDAATEPVDEARRNLLKLALIGGVAALGAAGGISALRFLSPPQAGAATYPRVALQYDDGSPILASAYRYAPSNIDLIVFNYPLTNEPNLLLNLGVAAPNGVGPKQNMVAFSAVCQHLGCVPPYISYYPAGSCGSFHGGNLFIHCVCHGSTYDPLSPASGGGASVITGPAQLPLPQVLLEWDQGTDQLYAAGLLGPPVRGHTSSLVGGTPVSSPIAASAPETPTQQCPG